MRQSRLQISNVLVGRNPHFSEMPNVLTDLDKSLSSILPAALLMQKSQSIDFNWRQFSLKIHHFSASVINTKRRLVRHLKLQNHSFSFQLTFFRSSLSSQASARIVLFGERFENALINQILVLGCSPIILR